jgi:DNA-binding transcriptional ArsR family regulator
MARRVAKDTPLAEIILRRYEKPHNLEGRELIKKLCLSIGLLQPGDSRDVSVDVFQVLIEKKEELSTKDIETAVIANREKHNLELIGITPPNIRRQLKRLKSLFLIETNHTLYRISENATLLELYEEKIKKYYLDSIVSRVKEYFEAVSETKE